MAILGGPAGPDAAAGTRLDVTVNNKTRKTEWLTYEYSELEECLTEIRKVFEVEGIISGTSWDGDSLYGVFLMGKPTKCSIDLSGFDPDPGGGNLMSLKLNVKDGSYAIKTYHAGNPKGVDLGSDKYIVATGLYRGEDRYTVYYVDPSTVEDASKLTVPDVVTMGFSAVTFYNNEEVSDESVYKSV
jgi:hypothetical protein